MTIDFFTLLKARMIRFIDGDAEQLVFLCRKLNLTKVCLYGAGELGQEVFHLLRDNNIGVLAWFDKNANDYNYKIHGLQICMPDQVKQYQHLPVVIASAVWADSIKNTLLENYGIERDKIIHVC
ncbi:hypothetical protein [Planctobacterium marinum]|uniref:hypothetical protein n=1 Tax=Planctobacterium marinum TaxID=1631968 RepID=UPI001E299649|nr:hypothetical protein [Planctobacterium marinum]MCC2606234.1 hypothetical protein [Planctobacterium marinum]